MPEHIEGGNCRCVGCMNVALDAERAKKEGAADGQPEAE